MELDDVGSVARRARAAFVSDRSLANKRSLNSRRLRIGCHEHCSSPASSGSTSVESTPLPETLRRLDALIQQEGLARSEFLDARRLAVRTALPEDVVDKLLRGGQPPAETVNERVRSRIKALADDRLARTGQRMSDLAGAISRQLGVSAFWARQVCAGDKVPSVELLHGLVDFFGVEGARRSSPRRPTKPSIESCDPCSPRGPRPRAGRSYRRPRRAATTYAASRSGRPGTCRRSVGTCSTRR